MSCFHGVTTVVAGNCGFSVAPCKPEDRDFLTGIFARVENMDPIALSAITWDEFVTFPDFLRVARADDSASTSRATWATPTFGAG